MIVRFTLVRSSKIMLDNRVSAEAVAIQGDFN
jgi:hypothetical protein